MGMGGDKTSIWQGPTKFAHRGEGLKKGLYFHGYNNLCLFCLVKLFGPSNRGISTTFRVLNTTFLGTGFGLFVHLMQVIAEHFGELGVHPITDGLTGDVPNYESNGLKNAQVPRNGGLRQWQFMHQITGDAAILGQEMFHNGQASGMTQGLENIRPLEKGRRVMLGFGESHGSAAGLTEKVYCKYIVR
jgi:hypothetical protein